MAVKPAGTLLQDGEGLLDDGQQPAGVEPSPWITAAVNLSRGAQGRSGRAGGDDGAEPVVFGGAVALGGGRGPGRYPALVAVTLRQASGLVTTLAGVARVPAVITATGGSFSVSGVGREGRTFTGSLRWVCGA
jgi:hypothetical protein